MLPIIITITPWSSSIILSYFRLTLEMTSSLFQDSIDSFFGIGILPIIVVTKNNTITQFSSYPKKLVHLSSRFTISRNSPVLLLLTLKFPVCWISSKFSSKILHKASSCPSNQNLRNHIGDYAYD